MACPKKTKTNINTKSFGDWIKFQTFGKKIPAFGKKTDFGKQIRFWENKLDFRKTNLIFGLETI